MSTETQATFKVWITKYALTRGIIEAEATDCFDTSDTMIEAMLPGYRYSSYFHGKNWHRDEASARKRANEMVAAKIKSLEKQLAKVRKMEF